MAAHDLEGNPVHERDTPALAGEEGRYRVRMEACVNPLHLDEGQDIFDQEPRRARTEPPLHEGDRFDDHVVMRRCLPLLVELGEESQRLLVMAILDVYERERGGVD